MLWLKERIRLAGGELELVHRQASARKKVGVYRPFSIRQFLHFGDNSIAFNRQSRKVVLQTYKIIVNILY